MALKILIIDQNESWTVTAQKFFSDLQYEVTSVFNGRDAQLALYNDKFFAIFINFEVENHSCTQFLKFIKSNYTNQRVIVVLDNPEFVASGDVSLEKLQKLGATELAVKPFELSHLKELLGGINHFRI